VSPCLLAILSTDAGDAAFLSAAGGDAFPFGPHQEREGNDPEQRNRKLISVLQPMVGGSDDRRRRGATGGRSQLNTKSAVALPALR